MPDIDISFDVNPINGELRTVSSSDSIKPVSYTHLTLPTTPYV